MQQPDRSEGKMTRVTKEQIHRFFALEQMAQDAYQVMVTKVLNGEMGARDLPLFMFLIATEISTSIGEYEGSKSLRGHVDDLHAVLAGAANAMKTDGVSSREIDEIAYQANQDKIHEGYKIYKELIERFDHPGDCEAKPDHNLPPPMRN